MDIREYKKALRKEIKTFRRNIPIETKKEYDEKITETFLSSLAYKNANAVLCYVSTEIEVDTYAILKKAFADKKTVAVPRCIPNTHFMDFIIIKSFDDLEKGSYGVLEPKLNITEKITNDKKSICVIPALLYDDFGYRLGYGGGYYDRFLADFKGKAVGIIYSENLKESLSHGKYDIPVSEIFTEKESFFTKK